MKNLLLCLDNMLLLHVKTHVNYMTNTTLSCFTCAHIIQIYLLSDLTYYLIIRLFQVNFIRQCICFSCWVCQNTRCSGFLSTQDTPSMSTKPSTLCYQVQLSEPRWQSCCCFPIEACWDNFVDNPWIRLISQVRRKLLL